MIFFLLFFIVSCTTPSSVSLPIDLENNRASMKFEANGKTYNGAGTLQRQAGIGTKITFFLPEGTILFQLDNCARERVEIRPKGNTFTYDFNPSAFKEAEDSCIMQAQATTYKGELQTSIIDWTDRRNLKARIWCNEEQDVSHIGVAVCQNRTSKLMWIEFDEPVAWAGKDGCPEPVQPRGHKPNHAFEIEVGQGFCPYGFINRSKERFRLTNYGYSTIREINVEAERIGR